MSERETCSEYAPMPLDDLLELDEFTRDVMVGACPKCGSENTCDCADYPLAPEDNPFVGHCSDCGTYWCLECGYVFETVEKGIYCPHRRICVQCSAEHGYLDEIKFIEKICPTCEHHVDGCQLKDPSECEKQWQYKCPYEPDVSECPKIEEFLSEHSTVVTEEEMKINAEGKPGREMYPQPAYITHDEYYRIWQAVKSGELGNLQGWDRVAGELMLQHPEYQYFWDLPHAVAMYDAEKALEQERVHPDAHLALEVLIIEQIKTVPEVRKAFDTILRIGKEEHETRHIIGRVFSEMFWEGSQMAMKGQQPDEDFYLRKIRYLVKYPEKVIEEQERKWREKS